MFSSARSTIGRHRHSRTPTNSGRMTEKDKVTTDLNLQPLIPYPTLDFYAARSSRRVIDAFHSRIFLTPDKPGGNDGGACAANFVKSDSARCKEGTSSSASLAPWNPAPELIWRAVTSKATTLESLHSRSTAANRPAMQPGPTRADHSQFRGVAC